MDATTALARLEAAGTEQNRKVHRRHGARDPLFGVSFPTLYALREPAEAAAGRIGPVKVDHGRTGCVTPAAVPYIARTWQRIAARAATKGAARATG